MAAFYNEIDPYCAQWLRNLIVAGEIAPGVVDERDMRDIRPDDLVGYTQCHFFAGIGGWSAALRLAGWADSRPVWTGSCPCQPFSQAGKGAGFDDERHLWPDWFHLISQRRPAVVFGEQVASKDGLAWLDLVYADMEGSHYAVGSADLCAAGVGAPHRRQRLHFVAHTELQPGRAKHEHQSRQRSAPGPQNIAEHRIDCKNGLIASAAFFMANAERRERASGCGEYFTKAPAVLADRSDAAGRCSGNDTAGVPATFLNGFWRHAEFIWCADEKWRAVEPGTFPLAHGVPARMGKLRAYGNAIVIDEAVEFILSASI